jgi:hypothetical protein
VKQNTIYTSPNRKDAGLEIHKVGHMLRVFHLLGEIVSMYPVHAPCHDVTDLMPWTPVSCGAWMPARFLFVCSLGRPIPKQ